MFTDKVNEMKGVYLFIEEEKIKMLKEIASEKGISFSLAVREAISDYIDKYTETNLKSLVEKIKDKDIQKVVLEYLSKKEEVS